jgi:hypothetical protein
MAAQRGGIGSGNSDSRRLSASAPMIAKPPTALAWQIMRNTNAIAILRTLGAHPDRANREDRSNPGPPRQRNQTACWGRHCSASGAGQLLLRAARSHPKPVRRIAARAAPGAGSFREYQFWTATGACFRAQASVAAYRGWQSVGAKSMVRTAPHSLSDRRCRRLFVQIVHLGQTDRPRSNPYHWHEQAMSISFFGGGAGA